MKQGNAFDLLNRLMPFKFQVIFVTAFDNYDHLGIALDYLLKPVDIDDMKHATERAKERMNGNIFLIK
jgi:two-component system LytT family response regulator